MSTQIRWSGGTSGWGDPLLFLMVLASDSKTPATDKVPTVEISKRGGAFAAPEGAITEVGHGWYKVADHPHDRDTTGPLKLYATAADCDDAYAEFEIVGYSLTQTAAESVLSIELGTYRGDDSLGCAFFNFFRGYDSTAGLPLANHPDAAPAGTVGPRLAPHGLDAIKIGIYTIKQIIRGIASIQLGKSSGLTASGVSSPQYKGPGEATVRVSATTDGVGNRSTVTLNLDD